MTMTYEEGFRHMKNLAQELEESETRTFEVEGLTITYPGYKGVGDYRLSIDGSSPSHVDIVNEIYNYTNDSNFQEVTSFLDDIYRLGTTIDYSIINDNYKYKIFWVTLQEDINYPNGDGRSLPFKRYYEAALVHKGLIEIEEVRKRTNNHYGLRPQLLELRDDIRKPSYYY